jgi:hypothetical protein
VHPLRIVPPARRRARIGLMRPRDPRLGSQDRVSQALSPRSCRSRGMLRARAPTLRTRR